MISHIKVWTLSFATAVHAYRLPVDSGYKWLREGGKPIRAIMLGIGNLSHKDPFAVGGDVGDTMFLGMDPHVPRHESPCHPTCAKYEACQALVDVIHAPEFYKEMYTSQARCFAGCHSLKEPFLRTRQTIQDAEKSTEAIFATTEPTERAAIFAKNFSAILDALVGFKNDLPAFRNAFWPAALDSLEVRASKVITSLVPEVKEKGDLEKIIALADGLGQSGVAQTIRDKLMALQSSDAFETLVQLVNNAAREKAVDGTMVAQLLQAFRAVSHDDDDQGKFGDLAKNIVSILNQVLDLWQKALCQTPLEPNDPIHSNAEQLLDRLSRNPAVPPLKNMGTAAFLGETTRFMTLAKEVIPSRAHAHISHAFPFLHTTAI